MHLINIRIVISTDIKRLMVQLTVSKVSSKNGNFQVLLITENDRLPATSSS
jgi:hypothetical protein